MSNCRSPNQICLARDFAASDEALFLDVPGSQTMATTKFFDCGKLFVVTQIFAARSAMGETVVHQCVFRGPADLECRSRQPPNAAIRALTIFFTIAAGNGLSVEKRIVPLLVSKSVNWSWNAFTTAELIG